MRKKEKVFLGYSVKQKNAICCHLLALSFDPGNCLVDWSSKYARDINKKKGEYLKNGLLEVSQLTFGAIFQNYG